MNNTTFDIKQLIRANIAVLKPYSSARDEFTDFDKDMVFLDANENPFNNGVNRYPDPQQHSIKKLLAAQKKVSEKNILLGNGSDEVLDLLFRAFCEPGRDSIITLPPTYGMYTVLANINNIKEEKVNLDSDFQPDVKTILSKCTSTTKLLFICSPNNPTGNVITQSRIIELLDAFNGIVVIDEAYIDFTDKESWVNQLKSYPNLVVTQTLSKAYGMAGIRLGICYASEAIIAVLNKIKPPYNINELTQQRALKRVANKAEVHQEVEKIVKSRIALENELKKIAFVEKIYPSDANFILVKVDDASKRYQQLIEKGIVVRNRSNQPLCENTIRFTVGTQDENKSLINAMNSL